MQEQIIGREFRKKFPQAEEIDVKLDEDGETILVMVDGTVYIQTILYDESFDLFHFMCETGKREDSVTFDVPEDWPKDATGNDNSRKFRAGYEDGYGRKFGGKIIESKDYLTGYEQGRQDQMNERPHKFRAGLEK